MARFASHRGASRRLRASHIRQRGSAALGFEQLERRLPLSANSGAAPHSIAETVVVLPAEIGTAEIHGFKWSDADGNGERNDDEPGLPGVTIYLDANDDGTFDPGEMSTVTRTDDLQTPTDETGEYAFTGLMAGTYIVREVVPDGYEQTYPDGPESDFDIEIVFPDNTLTPAQREIFTLAAARWEEIIIGDIPDIFISEIGLVDDVVIQASGPAIDGPGQILGQAGPVLVRTAGFLPITGVMEFDSADIAALMTAGQFDEVILHEMGHVLGIGTIWEALDLLTDLGGTNPQFIGEQATAAYNEIFGLTAASVPVEGDQGGGGTLYAHWDEATLANELMTGFLNAGVANPISRITVGQMADLGYEVNLNAADEYSPPALNAVAAPLPPLVEGWFQRLSTPFTVVGGAATAQAALAAIALPNVNFWTVELEPGEVVTGVNFGNKPLPASIEGRVWNDRDGDGTQDANEPGLADWTVFIDHDGDGEFDQSSEEIESTDVPVDILDLDTVSSSLDVDGLNGSIRDVNITFDITHTYDDDITMVLVSPSGRRVLLLAGVGGNGNDFNNTTLDDEASQSITSGFAPFDGVFRPQGPLSQFDGEDPNGSWTLEIIDTFAADVGSLNSWSLEIEAGELAMQTDAQGDYAFPDLAPGAYSILQVIKEDWSQTFPGPPGNYAITLAPGQDATGLNFGNRTGFIGGQLWNDYDADGVRGASEPALAGWTVYVDANANLLFDDGSTTIPATDVPQPIADGSTITSTITVGKIGPITDLDVAIDISHTYDADLDVFLISPDGVRIELFTDVGSFDDGFAGTILDDEAALAISGGSAPFAGRYRPESLLSQLDGDDAEGVWTLEVSDDTAQDVGDLLGWSLTFLTTEESAKTDADGNYSFFDAGAGAYDMRLATPVGWQQTLPVPPAGRLIQLAAGQVVTDANFGARTGALFGQKWNDLNNNGVREAAEAGLPGWVIYLDENGNTAFDHGAVNFASSLGPTAIPDLGVRTSTINVSGVLDIDDLDVTLALDHSDIADLDVYLISPSGTRVELFTDLAPTGETFNNTTLDDEASVSILAGAGSFLGSYVPEGALSALDGENPNGLWTLEVTDDAGNDVGILKSWSLTVSSQERSTVTDAEGYYQLLGMLPGTYAVREVPQVNWNSTFPLAGSYALLLGDAEQRDGVNFGAQAAILFGDYDRDGDVDGNDFVLWQRGLGTAVAAGSGPDGNGNSIVDADDLPIWRNNFGASAPAAAQNATAALSDPLAVTAAEVDEAFAEVDEPVLRFDAASLAGPLAYSQHFRAPRTAHRAAAHRFQASHASLGASRLDIANLVDADSPVGRRRQRVVGGESSEALTAVLDGDALERAAL